jgi:hypothetical protein
MTTDAEGDGSRIIIRIAQGRPHVNTVSANIYQLVYDLFINDSPTTTDTKEDTTRIIVRESTGR